MTLLSSNLAFSYSPSKFGGSSWKRDQSPVSVFHGPFLCSGSRGSISSTSVRSIIPLARFSLVHGEICKKGYVSRRICKKGSV